MRVVRAAAAGQRSWNVGVWSSPTIGMLIRIRFSVVETVIASSCSASKPTWPSRRYWKAVRTVSTPVPSAAKIVVGVEMRDDVGHERPAVDLAAHVAGPARAGELPEEAVELEVRPLLVRIVREGLADVDEVQRGEGRRGVVAGDHEVAVGGRGIRSRPAGTSRRPERPKSPDVRVDELDPVEDRGGARLHDDADQREVAPGEEVDQDPERAQVDRRRGAHSSSSSSGVGGGCGSPRAPLKARTGKLNFT